MKNRILEIIKVMFYCFIVVCVMILFALNQVLSRRELQMKTKLTDHMKNKILETIKIMFLCLILLTLMIFYATT